MKLVIKGNNSKILTKLVKRSYLIYNETMMLILYNMSKCISKVTREDQDFMKNMGQRSAIAIFMSVSQQGSLNVQDALFIFYSKLEKVLNY